MKNVSNPFLHRIIIIIISAIRPGSLTNDVVSFERPDPDLQRNQHRAENTELAYPTINRVDCLFTKWKFA